MIDYNSIWNSINAESRNSKEHRQIARRIPNEGIFPIFLASDFAKGIRLLYIKLDDSNDISIGAFPSMKGLEITLDVLSLGEFNKELFLKLSQTIPSTGSIFELFVSDMCDKIDRITNRQSFVNTIVKNLTEWKLFFERSEKKILPISVQKGLVSELFFLKDVLFRKYSFSESLSYWTGSERTNHDFQIRNIAVEIKSTSSKQHKKFAVSSERQLDSTGLSHLYVGLYALNIHSNMPDHTLPVLIRSIMTQIREDLFSVFQFQVKLAKYGYNEAHASKYSMGFSIVEMNVFHVAEGFPRLLQHSLPNGVGDLKYSVVVSACRPYEVQSDLLTLI
ncbi:MAG: PD-(D/E)XK motif protein [Cyclobacteriaceae bacterium]|nr:PD-(D/E)XK motif protein [Cyclobacteriaceae bacterium]